jgi:hypothetical protein
MGPMGWVIGASTRSGPFVQFAYTVSMILRPPMLLSPPRRKHVLPLLGLIPLLLLVSVRGYELDYYEVDGFNESDYYEGTYGSGWVSQRRGKGRRGSMGARRGMQAWSVVCMHGAPCRTAMMTDPYDDSSSWSSPAAEGGQCTGGRGASVSLWDDEYWEDAGEQLGSYAAGNPHVDPLYLYPTCVEDGGGSIIINGERPQQNSPRSDPVPRAVLRVARGQQTLSICMQGRWHATCTSRA